MKRFRYILFGFMLLINSCGGPEIRFFTRINDDGTVFKRVTAVGDSSQIHRYPFSFDLSDGWDLSFKKEIKDADTLFCAIAEKTFPSIEASTVSFSHQVDSGQKENIKIDYVKKFRWFFTFHEYTETFMQRFPYRHYNINDFLNNDERAYFLADDSTVISHLNKVEKTEWIENGEQKFWKFIFKSITKEYVRLIDSFAIQNGYNTINENQALMIDELLYPSFDNGPDFKEVVSMTDSLLKVKWISELYSNGYFNQFEDDIDNRTILLGSNNYNIEIELPGFIYQTNAMQEVKQSLKWQFRSSDFQYCDKVLIAHYRTVNWWAFIVTFIIIAILLWKGFGYKKK
nr:hypothetical protein [uncultured Carboxylicivirga sp.]